MITQENTYQIQFISTIILSLLCTTLLHSQYSSYDLKYYSIKDGLPDNHITSVLNHSNGQIWVGTINGLAKFDGYKFDKISLPKRTINMYGSKGPRIWTLAENQDGKILIKYYTGSDQGDEKLTDILDPVSLKVESLDNSILHESILTTSSCHNGKPIFKISGDTTTYFDCNNGNLQFIRSKNEITCQLLIDNMLLIDFSEIWKNSNEFGTLSSNDFRKNIFIGLRNGLLHVTPKTNPFQNYLGLNTSEWNFGLKMRALTELSNGDLIVSPERQNLIYLSRESGAYKALDFKDEKTQEPVNTRYMLSILPLPNEKLFAIQFQKSALLLDTKKQTSKLLGHFEINYCLHTISLKSGKILLSGLSKSNEFGLELIDPITWESEFIVLPINKLNEKFDNSFLFEAHDGNIWIAYTHGLILFDLKSRKVIKVYKHERVQQKDNKIETHSILKSPNVLVIHETMDNHIMAGVEVAGLHIIDPQTNHLQLVTTDNGIANNNIASIFEEEDCYWLATYSGLTYMDKSFGNIRNFYKENGLPNNEFNRYSFVQATDGRYFLGGMNGITSFEKDEIIKTDSSLKIYLTEARYYPQSQRNETLRLNNLNGTPVFNISATRRNCSFKFSLTDYKNVEGNEFSYQIRELKLFNDLDHEWLPFNTKNELRFDFLSAGKYQINVKGVSSDGIISAQKSFILKVNNFFYYRWWFITLIVFASLVFIYYLYRLRLAQLLRIEKLRTQLSSDLHDDVGSLLSGVAYQMEMLEQAVDSTHKPLVNRIATSSRKAMSQMRDVVWAIDSRAKTCEHLLDRMRDYANELLEPLDIDFEHSLIKGLEEKELTSRVKHELLLIFKEFLNNTIKHAEASSIVLSISPYKKGIEFQIKDDGKGLGVDPERVTGQGLNNFKMRVSKLNGDIQFLTAKGFGIRILIDKF